MDVGTYSNVFIIKHFKNANIMSVVESEQLVFLQTLLENIPGPVFYKDISFHYLGCNQAFCDFLGLAKEDIINHTADDFCTPELAAIYRLADEKLFNNPGVQIYETQVKYANGSLHDVVFHKSTFNDGKGQVAGLIGVILDISERKKAERQLFLQKQILQQTLDSLKEAIFRVDLDGQVLSSNVAAQKLLGYNAEELHQLRLSDMHPPGPSRQTANMTFQMMVTASESILPFESLIQQRSGDEIMCENTLIPLFDEEKNIREGLYVARDIQEQKKNELERIQTQKLRSIGQLAAGIAHEINTPAQYILNNVTFLAETTKTLDFLFQLPKKIIDNGTYSTEEIDQLQEQMEKTDYYYLIEELPETISQIQKGIQQIATIVNAMKEFSHPGGKNKESVNLNQLIENAVIVCRNEWKYLADMSIELDDSLKLVDCLSDQIRQVILNLIVNAAHAIEEKQKETGEEELGKITLKTLKTKKYAEIRVGDSGKGIAKDIQNRVFDPFFTTKLVGHGTGQGLAIAHDIICNKHQGKLFFKTEEDKGTTFVVQLPL